MKRIISNGAFVAMAAGAMLLSSCSDKDMFNPNYKAEEYAANWEKKFGKIDPNQDWSMATTVKANANMPNTNGKCVMTIYSSNPGNKDCTILAKTTLDNGKGNITFDVLKGQKNVYVTIDGQNDLIVNGYYPIENGTVNLDASKRAKTRAAGGEYIARTITLDGVRHRTLPEPETRPSVELSFIGNVSKTTIPGWTLGDWEKIVGKPDGKFVEGQANKYLYEELKNDDVIFTMAKDGPVTVKDMYGATDYYDRFGYFYYTGDPTIEELTKVKKYVIMENASVQNNIYLSGNPVKKCELANIIGFLDESWMQTKHTRDEIVYGSEYKLVYWGADGNSEASYTFPKGTKIGFFIHKVTGNADSEANTIATNETKHNEGEAKLMFSLKKLNAYYNIYGWKDWQETYDPANPEENGDWPCVSYRYGNTTIVGFEDGPDNDMNDIMWFMEGNFEETEKLPQMGEEPKSETNSWILACEDLGSTDDYDFNDIVLEVQKVDDYVDITQDGQVVGTEYKGSKLVLKCLAAGGTLPAYIYYDGQLIGESHGMLGSTDTKTMINTYNFTNTPQEVVVEESIDKDWTLTANKHKFVIKVAQSEESGDVGSKIVEAPDPGTAPQMIIVPGDWLWPTERTGIEKAYKDFTNWSSNASSTDWNEHIDTTKVVKR